MNAPVHNAGASLSGRRAALVFLCFASGYFLSFALRSVNAVVGPVLMQELGLSNADLGLLSAAYFVSFAALQLPLGVWLDQYGARRTEALLLCFAVAGCLLFAGAHSLPLLWLGRALIGIGVCSCLMAAFKAFRLWYPLHLQTRLASSMLVAGTSGALCSTLPVSYALPHLGWRGLFVMTAALLALVALALFFGLRKIEQEFAPVEAGPTPGFWANMRGYKDIFIHPYFHRLGILGLVNQAIFVAIQTLWAGPWLMQVNGLNKDQSSAVLFFLNLILLLAYLLMAWIAPRHIKSGRSEGVAVETVVAAGLGAALLLQIALLLWVSVHSWVLWLVLPLCVSVGALIQTHLSLSFAAELAGRTNSAYNLLIFVGAFCAQWGIGALIDSFAATGMSAAGAIRAAFAVCVVLQSGALLYFVCSRATPSQSAA